MAAKIADGGGRCFVTECLGDPAMAAIGQAPHAIHHRAYNFQLVDEIRQDRHMKIRLEEPGTAAGQPRIAGMIGIAHRNTDARAKKQPQRGGAAVLKGGGAGMFHLQQFLPGLRLGVGQRGDRKLVDLFVEAQGQRHEGGVPVGKEMIDRGQRHACRFGDLGQGDILVAVLGQQHFGRIKQMVIAFHPAPPHRARRSFGYRPVLLRHMFLRHIGIAPS
jgi:hypothetical protein